MKSRLSRIILSILILSLALQTFTFPAIAQSETNENQAKVENLVDFPEIEQPSYPDGREAQLYPEEEFENMPPELMERYHRDSETEERPDYIPPSPEIIAETQAQVNSFTCTDDMDVPKIECEALVALYESTNGAGWKNNSGWLQSTTVSNWYGVGVDSGVTGIVLGDNQLRGNIPAKLDKLSNLQVLELQSNSLTGGIPLTLGNLSNLRHLDLNRNHLTGYIPAELGNLSNLKGLSLYFNRLTGIIPPTLGNLSNLMSLELGLNQLTGSIPTELSNLSNLRLLDLDGNQLTGTIPTELGNLANLEILDLSGNQLTGNIPAELGNLSNLQELDLDNNQLTGSIPVELGNLSNLKGLYLYNNNLTGSIPSTVGKLSNLMGLGLSLNQLTDTIPTELGNLSNLRLLNLDQNQLTGSIPRTLGNLSNLWGLFLEDNQLTGSIPSTLGNLSSLIYMYLNDNQLTGSLPAELGNLSNLQWMDISNNQLTGSIPLSFVNLTKLHMFYFFETNLCEPTTPEFIAWKNSILDLWLGTGIICGENPTDASWLLMYYFALDNNLAKTRNGELKQVMAYRQSNIDIAIMLDKPGDTTDFLFSQQGGTFETFSFPDLNSGDGKTLTDFMVWAKSKSKAPSQALIIIDHGNGLAGIARDDSENKDYIKVNGELRTAILEAGAVDVIFASACLTGNIEFMWELRELTDYYVGSESITYGASHHYLRIVDQFTSPLELAILMAKELKGSFTAFPSTISVIDMNHISDIFEATNRLALAIYLAPIPVQDSLWDALKNKVQRFDGEDIDMFNTYADEMADLFHFAELVKDFDGISTSALNLLALEDDFVVYNKTQNFFYIYYKNAKGVSIHLPVNPASFYDGEWLDFGTGADWTFTGNGKKSTPQVEGYYWGPMISEMVRLYNPEGPDNPNPPDLFAAPPYYEIYLPLTTK